MAAEIFATACRLGLLLAGLLLPGAMILRALRLPWMLAASFTAARTTLVSCQLALDSTTPVTFCATGS